ncbi:hypothetical protein GCM10027570_44760 [Streptomonospora sediminis]
MAEQSLRREEAESGSEPVSAGQSEAPQSRGPQVGNRPRLRVVEAADSAAPAVATETAAPSGWYFGSKRGGNVRTGQLWHRSPGPANVSTNLRGL